LVEQARITQWPITEKHPFGELVQELGNVGDLAAEAKALLAENCINDQDFPNAALGCLPATPWHIPAVEFTKRRDLRFHRIFSIDPETAKGTIPSIMTTTPLLTTLMLNVSCHFP
jgi:protein SSD1